MDICECAGARSLAVCKKAEVTNQSNMCECVQGSHVSGKVPSRKPERAGILQLTSLAAKFCLLHAMICF